MLDASIMFLKNFREKIYSSFSHRQDASMELVDALSSNTSARSVVELSLNPHHRRNYSSLPRVVDEFYKGLDAAGKETKRNEVTKLLASACPELEKRAYQVFGVDCTPNPRLFSPTLSDRGFVHAPNPVPGNKPITLGHQYSIAAYFPEKLSNKTPPWLIAIACQRVGTEEKGTLVGMQQIKLCMNSSPAFKDKLCVSVGDSAYSSPECLALAQENQNQIHISRLRNTRNIYRIADKKGKGKKKGRQKSYGDIFQLSNSKTWGEPDEIYRLKIENKKGKIQLIEIKVWNDLLMRGHRDADVSNYPFRVIKIEVYKETGELLFKKPLWLLVAGERRGELSPVEIFEIYRQRFDLEHFFRFGKTRLLMDKFQTPETEHEEAYWQIVLMAYTQIYLAREIANASPNPWEKYLKCFNSLETEKTPTQTQKDFSRIIREIGTPAKAPKPRKKAKGRELGEKQQKRIRYKVVVKSKLSTESLQI
jgi:DDE superfamily endonuclease